MEATMRAKVTLLLLSAGIILSSCIATIGPEGPRGRDGSDGEVEIYNGTFVIDSDNDFGVEDEFISVASYSWGILDESTVDEGLVLAYIQFDGSTAWQSLPLSTPFENDVVVLRYGFDIDNFDLILEGESPNNNQINEGIFDGDIIRVIAIPPGHLFKGKNVDYSNFEQVKQIYNLDF